MVKWFKCCCSADKKLRRFIINMQSLISAVSSDNAMASNGYGTIRSLTWGLQHEKIAYEIQNRYRFTEDSKESTRDSGIYQRFM